MRHAVRFGLILSCCATLWSSPAFGTNRRALGVVTQTDRGHLDNADAVTGADIYSCEPLNTDDGGVLRARIGSNQIYLSALSAAQLEEDGTEIQVLITAGTVGFSEATGGGVAIRTPAGIVRGAGGSAAAGEVTFKGPKELLITSMRGTLTLDNGGELRTIPEGKSADVTFEDSAEQGCRDEAAADQGQQQPQQQPHPLRRPIGFYILGAAAVAIPAALLWHAASESDSKPPQ